MTRAKRFHCPVSTGWEFDVERLCAARKQVRVDGRQLSMAACVVKATSLLQERHPRFNRHLFHSLFGRRFEVAFEEIACTLVVLRRDAQGERMLFPLLIPRSNELSVVEIQRLIDKHKYSPLDELPQVRALERVKRLPRAALSYFSFKARSDPEFYLKYFGTFGVSQMAAGSFGPVAGHTIANTASAFLIGPLAERPHVKGGELTTRKTLGIMLVADHYVLDGVDILEGMRSMGKLLRDPSALGLEDSPLGAP